MERRPGPAPRGRDLPLAQAAAELALRAGLGLLAFAVGLGLHAAAAARHRAPFAALAARVVEIDLRADVAPALAEEVRLVAAGDLDGLARELREGLLGVAGGRPAV